MSAVGLSTRGPLAAPMAAAAFRAALAMDVKNSQGATQLLSDLGRYGAGLEFWRWWMGGYGYECLFHIPFYSASRSVLKKVMLYCNSDTRLFVTVLLYAIKLTSLCFRYEKGVQIWIGLTSYDLVAKVW